ncbi:MerR family transcriptional regulator [Pengzhenrongella sicca]|uniref:MerR family transcriptional regulator n=1 Tax=Pengzhenrongella sicca TaxID=2819238 RepID=A0A8A4ZB78_9MICO|nr:MerR family transcriptional regulator [Pengzhenrongella sicca]QTE29240.1 MerR family transcriptional regulator [Pengzhenrongella sicca]
MGMPSTGGRLLSIGEFSRLSRISVRMLRHYDEHGVLPPTRTDPGSGYRFYSADLLRTSARICALRDVGLGVAELAACVPLLDEPALLRAVLQEQRARLEVDAAAVASRIRKVVHLIDSLEAPAMSIDTNQPTEIIQRDLPARIVAAVRDTIGDYSAEGLLWQRLMSGLPATGARVAERPLVAAVFHDESFVESDADVEVQIDVTGPFESAAGVRCVEVPALRVAQATLHGSYDGIGSAVEALGRWIGEHDYAIAGPMLNVYVVGPPQEPDPASWLTEVCVPIHKA